MTYIAFRGLIKSDEHERFVFRCLSAGAVMQLNELVLQHPLASHSTFNGAAVARLARNTPVAHKIIEEQNQDHCRSGSRKHRELDSVMVFHFPSAINVFRSGKRFFDLNQTRLKLKGHAEWSVERFVDCLPSCLSLP